MPPKFNKSDYVKVLATRFYSENIRDRSGRLFSEQWAHEGNGIWCFGTVSRVYVKKGRQPQKYSIRYDGGQTMTSTEDQIEPANEDVWALRFFGNTDGKNFNGKEKVM